MFKYKFLTFRFDRCFSLHWISNLNNTHFSFDQVSPHIPHLTSIEQRYKQWYFTDDVPRRWKFQTFSLFIGSNRRQRFNNNFWNDEYDFLFFFFDRWWKVYYKLNHKYCNKVWKTIYFINTYRFPVYLCHDLSIRRTAKRRLN